MKYMLLIYESEANEPGDYQPWYDLTNEMAEAGVLLGGDELRPTTTATTVRVKNGQTIATDGPYVETREQLGGYYLLECSDLDEAIRWAAKMPSASRGGGIEVRPVVEHPQP